MTSPMKRGEVWWVNFDPSTGSEIKKIRPAIIVSNDSANRNLTRVIVVPVTSNTTKVYPGEARITVENKTCKAMADQMMAADKGRLKTKISELTSADLQLLEDAMLVQLGLPR